MTSRPTIAALAHELGVTGAQLAWTARDLKLRTTKVGATLTKPDEQALRDAFAGHQINIYRSDERLRVSGR